MFLLGVDAFIFTPSYIFAFRHIKFTCPINVFNIGIISCNRKEDKMIWILGILLYTILIALMCCLCSDGAKADEWIEQAVKNILIARQSEKYEESL